MKIAHLSDIHFFKFDLSPGTFFSKDLLATCNHLFNRSRHKIDFDETQFLNFLKKQDISHVIITGDFTTSSNLKEYALARAFLRKIKDFGPKLIIVPGNHDHYGKRAGLSKRFYNELSAPDALREESLMVGELGAGFKYIALDTTLATPFWSSQGLFSAALENRLLETLEKLGPKQPLVLINHFPIITRKKMPIRQLMIRYEHLKKIVKDHPNIKIYMNGHTHLSEMIQSDAVILNSGSLTLTEGGSFHIMDLSPQSVAVTAYGYQDKQWVEKSKKNIPLS